MRPLPPPSDLGAAPRANVAEAVSFVGEAAVASACVDLLNGAPAAEYADFVAYLGGRPGVALLAGEAGWDSSWARVWAARGLRYAWVPSAETSVLAALHDPQWRVVEHCLALVAFRDLGPAGEPSATLVHHELPRMRIAACRALAVAADVTELAQLATVALTDADGRVRSAAQRALEQAAARLDVDFRSLWADS